MLFALSEIELTLEQRRAVVAGIDTTRDTQWNFRIPS